MKQILLFWIILFTAVQGHSQFPVHMLLPMGVSGNVYGDTLINTRTILQKAGIRKIISYQSSPEITKTFSPISMYLSVSGNIQTTVACNRYNKSDMGFCISDTFLYDPAGRLQEFISKDGKGNIYLRCKVEYVDNKKVKYTWISAVPQQPIADTIINCHYYNEKNQLVRFEQEQVQSVPGNASIYYGNDGIPDSITHDNPILGKYVFKRKGKRKRKEIETETDHAKFKWIYNSLGQCISSEWARKNPLKDVPTSKQKSSDDGGADYFYNPDGTLSKVVEKRNGAEITTISYSYAK